MIYLIISSVFGFCCFAHQLWMIHTAASCPGPGLHSLKSSLGEYFVLAEASQSFWVDQDLNLVHESKPLTCRGGFMVNVTNDAVVVRAFDPTRIIHAGLDVLIQAGQAEELSDGDIIEYCHQDEKVLLTYRY